VVNRRLGRQALQNRAWREKLLNEGRLLSALGYLDDEGDIACPECGRAVVRSDGWRMVLVCACGWRMEDFDSEES
jgi:hypothetical protein